MLGSAHQTAPWLLCFQQADIEAKPTRQPVCLPNSTKTCSWLPIDSLHEMQTTGFPHLIVQLIHPSHREKLGGLTKEIFWGQVQQTTSTRSQLPFPSSKLTPNVQECTWGQKQHPWKYEPPHLPASSDTYRAFYCCPGLKCIYSGVLI